ncbi:2390_t:CDS:2 [Dentiscutata heterogama]|uniref:2390_t:CDS:1 n=1 Tax=Dentiscutata heterogama TaxID=1316150 RepID=A0ACA9JZ69_9GLOM|nr:2390_t:CDS:2 [Dentiscutata heterogama]
MRPWSDTETAHLLMLCQIHGRDWRLISKLLGRTPKECHNRYFELNPALRRQPTRVVRRQE